MVNLKDEAVMAEPSSAPNSQPLTISSNPSSTSMSRKQRPYTHLHHHHIHLPFQHFSHYHQYCTYPSDTTDVNGSTNGVSSPAKFYFGPGFEPQQQITGGFYGPGPSQSQNNEYVVFFHVNPGVTISFQMGDNLEVLRGNYYDFDMINISYVMSI